MKQFKQLVKELPNKKVVMAFGRFQPPTTGHLLVVAAVKHIAQKQNADHVIYASRSQDKKSNPLPVDRKVYYLKRMFPGANFVGANEHVRTFMEAAKDLNKKYKNLVMIAGSDRVPEYKKLLEKYNGKEFHYDTIEVVSAGERDPDSEGASGMSGTKMRDAAKKGDFDSFKRGLPTTLTTVDAKRLMNEIREGMGLEVIREKVELDKDKIREAYHAGDIFNVGDIVECADVVYKIQKRGSNHLLLLDESGNLVSKWLQDVAKTTKEFTLLEGLTEMKYTGTDKIKVARVIANALGVVDVEKSSNPELLINNALRKIRSKPMRPEYVDVLHKMLETAKEAGIAYDEKLVPQKVTEGVKQPNGTDKVGGIVNEISKETLKSYIPKAMGSKSAADFTRGVKMAQGSGGEEELRRKSEKRSAGIHTAIKKLTKEELEEAAKTPAQKRDFKNVMAGAMSRDDYNKKHKLGKYAEKSGKSKLDPTGVYHNLIKTTNEEVELEEAAYWQKKSWQKKMADAAKKERQAREKKEQEVKEEVELEEGKMGELHDTISRHLDKHISDFKSGHTGMDQFGSKVLAAHKSVAKAHGLEHKHAAKMVNDYVDSKLNESLEEGKDYSVTVTHYADGKHTKHEYTVKNANDYKHAKHIAMQRHGKKIGTLKQGEQYGASNMDVKELNKESYNEISDLLEQIATATMMGKDTEQLKKKLSATRNDIKNNESDVEASHQDKPEETKIGHSVTADHETDTVRRMKVRQMTEGWVKKTINGVTHYFDSITGQRIKKEEVDLEEDQATAEYKVKTYYDNNQGKTVTRKVRPHKVTFSGSKKNAEPEVDEPGEDIKEGIEGVPAGDMGGMPAGAPDAYVPTVGGKKTLGTELEETEDEEINDSELDGMADTITDLDDIIDAYDDDELHIVDDNGDHVEELKEEVINEVLSRMERIKAKVRFAQSKSKRERKMQIALKTPSTMGKLNKRARLLAVKLMKQRIARKPLDKLSTSEKERVEDLIHKRKKAVDRLAMRLVSRVKKIEQNRLHRG